MSFKATVIAVIVLISSSAAMAQSFQDNFDGSSLDASKWNRAGGGTLTVAGGFASSEAACGEFFPYARTLSDPFPASGDFIVTVGFRYTAPSGGGNGFGNPDFTLGSAGSLIWVWQDACCGGLRAACGERVITLAGYPDAGYHIYQWQYLSGTYFLYVDGALVTSDTTSRRPSGFFFGHPPAYPYCGWSSQQIDFVTITSAQPTTTSRRSWSSVKAVYR